MFKIILLFFSLTSLANEDFASFIQEFKTKALNAGISEKTVNLLDEVKVIKRTLELDKKQPEFSLNFTNYITARLSQWRFETGKPYLYKYDDLFKKIYKKYGLPRHILLAFWGLESNYSKTTGTFKLLDTLATLSYDKRRRVFFSRQLLNALELIDKNIIDNDVKASWAGAMGGVQFMPSNLLAYGVDGDNDGKIDLWHNPIDMFMSAANFLQNIGWHKGEKWGREIVLPADFDYALANLKIKKTLNQWASLGIKNAKGQNLPNSKMLASVIVPMGESGPKFLVYRNFKAIMNWNYSVLYALSVGLMADKFIAKNLLADMPNEPNLKKDDIKFIQKYLNNNGFNAGPVDGVLGSKTQNAVRNYQKTNNLVVDGYVGFKVLENMKQKSTND
jgi:membrane-bound lytic murein transglycosylase B